MPIPTLLSVISQVAMRALGFDVKKADVLKVLRDYDRDGTGKISFEDFNEVCKCIHCMYGFDGIQF